MPTLPSVYRCVRDINFRRRRTGYKLFGKKFDALRGTALLIYLVSAKVSVPVKVFVVY